MPSPGDEPVVAAGESAALLEEAREFEATYLPGAITRLEEAIAVAEAGGERVVLAEALRHLAIARHHRGETSEAQHLCRRSYDVARAAGHQQLAAEALNSLGAIDLTIGSLEDAKRAFLEARELGAANRALRARVEQNLGILANIVGNRAEALGHYERSLEDYRAAGDDHGCAVAYHNLGMLNADRGRLEAAACYYQESYAIAERMGNLYLQGLCLVNHGEVEIAQQRSEVARQKGEAALVLFKRLGMLGPQASAHRVIGMAYRESGRSTLAEASFAKAIDVAVNAGSVLNEANASRELGLLYQSVGRTDEALELFTSAQALFRSLNARVEVIDLSTRIAELKRTLASR